MPYGNTRPVRIRDSINMHPVTSYGYRDGTLTSSHTQDWWTDYFWMLDQINPVDKKKKRRVPGVCQHLKVNTVFARDQLTYLQYDGGAVHTITGVNWLAENYAGGNGQSPAGSSATRPNDKGFSNLVAPIQSTPTYQNLVVSAFNKQITQVPAKISLLNFLFELKDFKELGKSLSKIPGHLKRGTLGQQTNLITKHKRSLPKVAAKGGVDTFLSWNFQWAPFISDLQTLTKIGDTAYKRLDYLRKTAGKEVTVRYEVDDCYNHPDVGKDVYHLYFGGSEQYYVLRSYECKFVSSWRLFHNLKDINDALSGLKSIYASLGLNNPIKAFWNAIPFSFMLDWVGPFGKWLEKAAAQPFTGEWSISEVTSSTHEVYYIDFYNLNNYDQKVTLMQTVKVDRYTRLDGLPITLGAFDFSQLTDTQQKLALAIPLSKVLK